MEAKKINAYAKINLGLDVISKRADGYHNVYMIMQSINLYDTLTIHISNSWDILIRTGNPNLPTDRRNLVYRAAELFRNTYDIKDGLIIDLEKRIPIAAGLAGGSSDAAATLLGLNELYQTGLSNEMLRELGVRLGADVPYCIMMGTVLAEGIGDVLTPLTPVPDCDILLVKPNISVSTKHVYKNLRLEEASVHPDIPRMLSAIRKQELYEMAGHMGNILETVTVKEYPVIRRIKEDMMYYGALQSLMSGSGPSVFGIFDNREAAIKAYETFRLQSSQYQVFLAKPHYPSNHFANIELY